MAELKGAAAYLLAAGRGRRAGGPKAWREHEGQSLLARQVGFLTGLLPAASVAVSVQDEWLERCRSLHPDVRWVAVDGDGSPLRSLQALLVEAPVSGWVFLHHVDMPVWNARLFHALHQQAEKDFDAVRPRFRGKGGHPLLISGTCAREIAGLDGESDRLDYWLKGKTVREPELDFPEILENWNQV
ncbi:MAG: nucleotidyltransferase family protein [Elusimicrobiota bacterium]|mgnify:CR=1 FL=1